MDTYPTLSQATGVARTLSKRQLCTIVVYRTPDEKVVTARPNDRVEGTIEGVYREGYLTPTVFTSTAY